MFIIMEEIRISIYIRNDHNIVDKFQTLYNFKNYGNLVPIIIKSLSKRIKLIFTNE